MDVDAHADPVVILVEHEYQIVFIHPVEKLLIVHIAAVFALDQQRVVHQRKTHYGLSRVVVEHRQPHLALFGQFLRRSDGCCCRSGGFVAYRQPGGGQFRDDGVDRRDGAGKVR